MPRSAIRALFYVRPTASEDRGGDWLQLLAQRDALLARGIASDISTDPDADLSSYDVVVLWNAIAPIPTLQYYFNARRFNKPVVLVPFYWSLERAWDAQSEWTPMPDTPIARELEQLRRQIHLFRTRILVRAADSVLPLSQLEAAQLISTFDCDPDSLHLIHAGVSPSFSQGSADRFRQKFGISDFILCVGFLAPRKNQLTLIRALRDDPHPLVLIGDAENEAYAQVCRAAAAQERRAPVHFLPRQDAATIADALTAANVHVLVSLYDIGPLVTLEAAQAGCPQVVTTECGMKDYFGDAVTYTDPQDEPGIRQAIAAAQAQPRSHALATRLTQEFTWERAAHELADALRETLAQPHANPDISNDLAELTNLLERRFDVYYKNSLELERWAQDLNAQLLARRPQGRLNKWLSRAIP